MKSVSVDISRGVSILKYRGTWDRVTPHIRISLNYDINVSFINIMIGMKRIKDAWN